MAYRLKRVLVMAEIVMAHMMKRVLVKMEFFAAHTMDVAQIKILLEFSAAFMSKLDRIVMKFTMAHSLRPDLVTARAGRLERVREERDVAEQHTGLGDWVIVVSVRPGGRGERGASPPGRGPRQRSSRRGQR